MKFLPVVLWFMAAFCPLAMAQTSTPDSESAQKEAVAKPRSLVTIDGEVIKGLVRVADAYNLSILTDNGIISLPIARLSEKDLKEYDKDSDRSQDGKFWSERKSSYDKSSKKDPDITNPIAYFSQFDSLITIYDSSKEQKKEKTGAEEKPEPIGKPLFSAPNSVAVPSGLDAMFGPGSRAAAASAGESVGSSAAILSSGAAMVGGAAGLPAAVPTMPTGGK